MQLNIREERGDSVDRTLDSFPLGMGDSRIDKADLASGGNDPFKNFGKASECQNSTGLWSRWKYDVERKSQ